MDQLGDPCIELLLQLDASARSKKDLYKHNSIAALDSQILRVGDHRVRVVRIDELESVIAWNADGLDHCLMYAICNCAALFGTQRFTHTNANERHHLAPC